MKVRSAIKRICGFCQIIRRGKNLFVRCQKNNRHKQRQGYHTLDAQFKAGDKNHCECTTGMIKDLNTMELNFIDNHKCNKEIKKEESIDKVLDEMNNKLI